MSLSLSPSLTKRDFKSRDHVTDLQSEVQGGHETYPKIIKLVGGDSDTNPYSPHPPPPPLSPFAVMGSLYMSNDLETEEGIAQEALAGLG